VRARIAAGLCERIAEWNGFGRIILPSAAGVDAEEGSTPDPSTSMALMAQVLDGPDLTLTLSLTLTLTLTPTLTLTLILILTQTRTPLLWKTRAGINAKKFATSLL